MMSSRTASRRARFLLPYLAPRMRVLDVGCGPGSITLGLARSVGTEGACVGIDLELSQVELARQAAQRAGASNVDFELGSVYALPFEDETFDAVFAHALFEHLARPGEALAELRRVLRAGGVLGVCSSDWSGAVVEPRTPDVEAALCCHFALRRRAGGDPFGGGRLPALVGAAGFVEARTTVRNEADMSYGDLAVYIGGRIKATVPHTTSTERAELISGANAAERWAQSEGGRFTQRWVAVAARGPACPS